MIGFSHMEPSPQTMEEIGRLCGAWSFLEMVTETTLWGIVDANEKLGPLITWRLDLRSRWQLILEYGPKKHDEKVMAELRKLNKAVAAVARDRNIIVHGLVHAQVKFPDGVKPHRIAPEDVRAFNRVPCWTVFRGAEAGKSFPVSQKAVEIVRINVQNIGQKVRAFNKVQKYKGADSPSGSIEQNWPKPLE